MSSSDSLRATHTARLLMDLCPSVREAVLSDSEFRKQAGVSIETSFTIGTGGAEFNGPALVAAVKNAFRKAGIRIPLQDTQGSTWSVEVPEKTRQPRLVNDVRQVRLERFDVLNPNKEYRLKSFLAQARAVNLPPERVRVWRSVIGRRSLRADEFAEIQSDLSDTPIERMRIIDEAFSTRGVSISDLVPHSPTYYERLVGQCGDKQSLSEYIDTGGRTLIRELLSWNELIGMKLALLLVPQPALSTALFEAGLDSRKVHEIFRWLEEFGDPMSCAAAIEIGIRIIATEDAFLRPSLLRLARRFVENKQVANVDQFELISALFVAIYGEIATSRLLVSKPPYWRKLAALAQASLVFRCIRGRVADAAQVLFRLKARTSVYMLQGFCDLRAEPRWLPEFGFPEQLKNELYGRVWMAALAHLADEPVEFRQVFLDGEDSVQSRIDTMSARLPGPLEGGVIPPDELSAANVSAITKQLASSDVSLDSFVEFGNAAVLVRLPEQLPELAAGAIARVPHQRFDQDYLIQRLDHIAFAAAVTRSGPLAEALLAWLFQLRNVWADVVSSDVVLQVAAVACASRPKKEDWCRCLGIAVTQLAFGDLTFSEAQNLRSIVLDLCHLMPELWTTCGQAEAALVAVPDK